MTNDNNNQWLDPLLERHIHREPETFELDRWAEKHPDEARLLSSGFEDPHRSSKTKPFEIWRSIMESKVTRYSAVAVGVLAVTLVLFAPFGMPGNGGVVLAEVQKKVADAETMIVRGQKLFKRPGEKGELFEFDGMPCRFDLLKHFSKKYGLVEEGRVEGRLIYRITFNRQQRQALVVLPPWKKYLKFTSRDEQGQALASMTPKGIIDMLLSGGYEELGRDKIDGVEVEGFEFHQAGPIPELFPELVFNIQSAEGKVWIGTKDQLPVRIEGILKIGKSMMTAFNDLHLHETNTLELFDAELDEDIFNLDTPDGYTELTVSDILQFIPAKAKAGLAGFGILPAGFIVWRRRKRRRAVPSRN